MTTSLISKDASTAIKGLLMLLVILGHTRMLTTVFETGQRTFLWHWLYSFHVFVFMILPFIYGYTQIGEEPVKRLKNDVKHNLIKFGVPYCWFFAFSALVYVTVGRGDFNARGMLYAFFFGNQPLMDKYIGFNFVWFLPAMVALTMVKSLWYNSSRGVRYCMLTASVMLWLLAIFGVLPQSTIGMFVPFSLSQAFYYLLLGLSARWLVERVPVEKALPWILLLIGVVTAMMFCQRTMIWPNVIDYAALYRLIMPVLMSLLLYGIGGWLGKLGLLKFIGRYSLQVYLVHVYVINVLEVILSCYFSQSVGLGVAIYFVTLAVSLGLAITMVKVPIINKVVFPKG